MSDSKDGLTAWAAIRLLFPEPEPEPIIVPDKGWSENFQLFRPPPREAWPWTAVPLFQDVLEKGSWHATGRVEPITPTSNRERIPADLWDILDLNPDEGTASAAGLKYIGLRFFESVRVRATTPPLNAERACHIWLVDLMATSEKAKVKDAYRADASDELFGPRLTDSAFRRAWKAAIDNPRTRASWKKPGPPK